MGAVGGFRPLRIVGEEVGFEGATDFEELEREREEGISRGSWFTHPAIEGDESVLGSEDEAHDAAHSAGEAEKGVEYLVDDPLSFLDDLTQVGEAVHVLEPMEKLGMEEGEQERREEDGAVDRMGPFSDLRIDFGQKLHDDLVLVPFQIISQVGD